MIGRATDKLNKIKTTLIVYSMPRYKMSPDDFDLEPDITNEFLFRDIS